MGVSPGSMALGKALTAEARTLADWEPHPRVIPEGERAAIEEACSGVAPLAGLYVETYLRTGNHSAASAILGISPSTPQYWRKKNPHYQTLFDSYQEEIRDRWNAVAQAKGMQGFNEWTYGADGELKTRRVREDPGFVRALLGSIDPERWGKDSQAQTIVVNVLQAHE